MQIETERLLLEPFTLELIDAAMRKDYEKIEELGYISNSEWPEEDLIEALPLFRDMIVENGVNGFNSWLILDKESRKILGGIGFIGNPDENGSVEIGFGINPSERRKGYCHESAVALMKWAMADEKVLIITAQCEETNDASKSIIAKLGFKEVGVKDGLINWELNKIAFKAKI